MNKRKIAIISILACVVIVSFAIVMFVLTQKKINITLISDGVVIYQADVNEGKVVDLNKLAKGDLKKEGYEFKGWYLDEAYSSGPFTSIRLEGEIEEFTFYAKWVNQTEVDQVISEIDSLPEIVTFAYEEQINNIFTKYNTLDDTSKTCVTNANKLKEQINKINLMKDLISRIDALPETITSENTNEVNSLLEIYNSLEEIQKADITNYEKLVQASESLTN